jgi:hypothetical protein
MSGLCGGWHAASSQRETLLGRSSAIRSWQPPLFEMIEGLIWGADHSAPSAQIAERLGMTDGAVRASAALFPSMHADAV